MNSLSTLVGATIRRRNVPVTVTVKQSAMPISSQTLSAGYVWNVVSFTGTFSVNEISASYSSGSFTLPDGNYIIMLYYALASSPGNAVGLGLQLGTSQSPSANFSLLQAWKYGSNLQAASMCIGASFNSSTTTKAVRSWGSSGNAINITAGEIRIMKIETSNNLPSGGYATAVGPSSLSTGWQVAKMSSTSLSSIPNLSHNSTTGEFTIPAGTFLITYYLYLGNSGVGFQTSGSATAPSSITNPTELDCYERNTNANNPGMCVSTIYTFTTSSPFRVYLYSGANVSGLTTTNIYITQLL